METITAKGIFSEEKGIITPTYKEQAYKLLKEAILYQRFVVGEVYSQDSICNELGISRTPVREALLELQKAGYIRFCRGRGIIILPVTSEEALCNMEMRICNEKLSARLAVQRASEEDLRKIKDTIDEMEANIDCGDSTLLYKLDRKFHSRVNESSHNVWLTRIIEDLRDHFLRFENQTVYDKKETGRVVFEEHKVIYEAIYNRDEGSAEKAMDNHLTEVYHRMADQFKASKN